MAEGTKPGLETVDLAESVVPAELATLEDLPIQSLGPDVRPKERTAPLPPPHLDQEMVDANQVMLPRTGGVREWWLGSLGQGGYGAPPPLLHHRSPPPGANLLSGTRDASQRMSGVTPPHWGVRL